MEAYVVAFQGNDSFDRDYLQFYGPEMLQYCVDLDHILCSINPTMVIENMLRTTQVILNMFEKKEFVYNYSRLYSITSELKLYQMHVRPINFNDINDLYFVENTPTNIRNYIRALRSYFEALMPKKNILCYFSKKTFPNP